MQTHGTILATAKSMESTIAQLGDDFEALLRSRLRGHQNQLDRHRSGVNQKLDWLSPARPHFADPTCTPAEMTSGVELRDAQRHNTTPGSFARKQPASNADHPAQASRQLAPSTNTSERHRPKLSDTTVRLAEKRRADLGVENLPIEKSLAARAEYSKTLQWLTAQSVNEQEVPAKPTITEKASALPSSTVEETTNRLYQSGGLSNERVLYALKTQLESLIDENLGATFKPTITNRAEQLTRRPNSSAHDDLYEQAKAQREYRILARATVEEKRESEMRARTPRINRLSALIAERLPESSNDRLFRPKRQSTEHHANATAQRSYSTSRTAALHNDHALRKARILALAAEKEALTEEHTFAPSITLRGRASSASATHVTDRLSNWEARKNLRLKEKREEERRNELLGCTFVPNTNAPQRALADQEPRWDHLGVEEHSLRHRMAREQKHLSSSPKRSQTTGGAIGADAEILRMAIEALHRARTASKRSAQ